MKRIMERYSLEIYRLIVDLNQNNTYAEIASIVNKNMKVTEPLEARHVAMILKNFKLHGYRKANRLLKEGDYETALKISVGIDQKIPERKRGRRISKSENEVLNHIATTLVNDDQKE